MMYTAEFDEREKHINVHSHPASDEKALHSRLSSQGEDTLEIDNKDILEIDKERRLIV